MVKYETIYFHCLSRAERDIATHKRRLALFFSLDLEETEELFNRCVKYARCHNCSVVEVCNMLIKAAGKGIDLRHSLS